MSRSLTNRCVGEIMGEVFELFADQGGFAHRIAAEELEPAELPGEKNNRTL